MNGERTLAIGTYKIIQMQIDGSPVVIKKPAKELYEHFTELSNFESLMPENTEKFEVDGDTFIFGLKGMPEIRLILKEKVPYSKIILGAASSKMPFTLAANLEAISENETKAWRRKHRHE